MTQASFLTFSNNSTFFGSIDTRSIASRFSIKNRANIAIASCLAHSSNSGRMVFDKLADLFRLASSKSSNDRSEASNRKDSGGMVTDSPQSARTSHYLSYAPSVNNRFHSTPQSWREVMGIAQPIISFRADIDTLFCLEQLHEWFPFLSQSQRCNVTFKWAWKYAAEHKIDLQSDIAQRVLLISLSKRFNPSTSSNPFTNSTKPIPPKSIPKTRKVAASA